MPVAGHPHRYQFTVEEFHQLGEVGILGENDRIELLDGELIVMSPIGYRHSYVVTRLNKLFVLRAKNRYEVQPQNPVALSDISEPQPDLALVRSEVVSRAEGLPEPEDTFLIVEIADASLRYDRGRKLRAYARAGIAELWIVNLKDNTIEIHREPEGETYRFSRIARGREKVAPAAFPDVAVVVEKLIP